MTAGLQTARKGCDLEGQDTDQCPPEDGSGGTGGCGEEKTRRSDRNIAEVMVMLSPGVHLAALARLSTLNKIVLYPADLHRVFKLFL